MITHCFKDFKGFYKEWELRNFILSLCLHHCPLLVEDGCFGERSDSFLSYSWLKKKRRCTKKRGNVSVFESWLRQKTHMFSALLDVAHVQFKDRFEQERMETLRRLLSSNRTHKSHQRFSKSSLVKDPSLCFRDEPSRVETVERALLVLVLTWKLKG